MAAEDSRVMGRAKEGVKLINIKETIRLQLSYKKVMKDDVAEVVVDEGCYRNGSY
jgi:DNA gyrase subunit A